VLPLSEAVTRLCEGSLPPRSVSLTFDDGYANNIRLAYPLLAKYGVPATIFLSSSYIESGSFYPFLKLKLIRLSRYSEPLPDYKNSPIDAVLDGAQAWWPEVEAGLAPEIRETLRPMTVEDVAQADPQLLEFGAHTHSHCILRNESPARRRAEISTSIRKVREWAGRPQRLFSYPNGETGDFNAADKEILKAEGIAAAVSGIGGSNNWPADLLELRRFPITVGHTKPRFRAEITGFRNAIARAKRVYA
jgi:peptidoglycan/xylan/chitin deacetylase (PgdA/CDA1 family)